MTKAQDLAQMLKRMQPKLMPGTFVFCTLPERHSLGLPQIKACIREPEGLSVVLEEQDALSAGLSYDFRAAWITLNLNSDLAALGLTAAFSAALAGAEISCNVIAGRCHDHIFVPVELAPKAMQVLYELGQSQQ